MNEIIKRGSLKSFKVLLTDADRFPLSKEDKNTLEEAGVDVFLCSSQATEQELIEYCRDMDGLLVFAAKITRPIIEKMRNCRVIARCGTGYNNIDLEVARNKNMVVTYVPDYGSDDVANHTIALILDCVRKVTITAANVRIGKWDNYPTLKPMFRFSNLTLGLLGFGRIARATASKAKALGFQIMAFDPFVPTNDFVAAGVIPVTKDELFLNTDILSVHTPLSSDTYHIIGRSELSMMKKGSIIINTSRGSLVDEKALIQALQSGHLGGAGLDVLETEPPNPDNPLLKLNQVVITPHSAAFTEEAIGEVKSRAIADAIRVLHGETPKFPVFA